MTANRLTERVAVLGFPDSYTRFHSHAAAPWSHQALRRVASLGFNAVQLNLAWGARPDDEPLNLEDVVELGPADASRLPQVVPLNCKPGPIMSIRLIFAGRLCFPADELMK